MPTERQAKEVVLAAFCKAKRKAGMGAFTVTELMLSVAIMGMIIFALYSVFNQTQRALRATQTQGDVSEKARAIIDIISRELQQAHPTFSALPATNRASVAIQEVNMLGGFEFQPQYTKPQVQKSDRADIQPRTNFFHNLFFYTNHTNAWQAIGYRVVYVTNGVGVLERFETNQFGFRPVNNTLSSKFINEPLTNVTYHHVADGVVHMSFIPYDGNGRRLGFDTTNRTSGQYKIFRGTASGGSIAATSDVTLTNLANVLLYEGYPGSRAETMQYASRFSFRSNAMPASVEMEFGILEPETLAQYNMMVKDQNPNAANFLAKQISKVHLFRQRIPIRTAAQ